jgi:thioesterase domain-containing protein
MTRFGILVPIGPGEREQARVADLGWGKWACGGVDIKMIPGHHSSILREPAVATLAAFLKSALERTYSSRW